MAWTKVKIAAGLGMSALVAYLWHQNLDQTQQITVLQGQLQMAAQQRQTQQAAIDTLKRQEQAMARENMETKKAASTLLEHQRAATAAAKKAGAGTNSSFGSAISKMMEDPAMKDMMRQQQVSMLKSQYAPLIKKLNLTSEAADSFIQLLADNTSKNMNMGMALLNGEKFDPEKNKQAMADAKTELTSQMQTLLGPDGYAQYDAFSQDVPYQTLLKLIKDQMTDNPLNDDQSARLLQLMKAIPIPNDPAQFSSGSAIDQAMQMQADNNQHILQQAADFLTPDQLASLGAYQTNMLNMEKVGMNMMKDKSFNK